MHTAAWLQLTSAIAGARSAGQIQETVSAGDVRLATDVIADIEALQQTRERAIAAL